jgi:ABC-type branched-subunit amino acid transport system permease subunit
MEKSAYLPSIMIRLECLLVEWEGAITALVTLCAIVAIVLGVVWLFVRKDTLLFTTLGFSSCYFIGRNFWRFRSRRISLEN